MTEVIRVNFSKPMALFPLRNTVLLPHAVQPLHIFERRYRQMIDTVLDGSGQVAMACIDPAETEEHECDASTTPTLRPAVCVGQIIEHEDLLDGRHNILLHGVCRARIEHVIEPENGRLYRLAMLSPLEKVDREPPPLPGIRRSLQSLLKGQRLQTLRCVDTVLEWFEREEVSTHALLELIGFALVRDVELRYQLLAESKAKQRARLISGELRRLDRLIAMTETQSHDRWPKGISWN